MSFRVSTECREWWKRTFHSNFSNSSDPQLCANSENCSAHSFPVTLDQTWNLSVHTCISVVNSGGVGLLGRFLGLSLCIAIPSLEACATKASCHLRFSRFWSRSPPLRKAAVFSLASVLLPCGLVCASGQKARVMLGSPHLFPSLRSHRPALPFVQAWRQLFHGFSFLLFYFKAGV